MSALAASIVAPAHDEVSLAIGSMTVRARPPGPIDVDDVATVHMLVASTAANVVDGSFDGTPAGRVVWPAGAFAWCCTGSPFVLRGEMKGWSLLLEIDPIAATSRDWEPLERLDELDRSLPPRSDPAGERLTDIAVEELRRGAADPHFLENVALALVSRMFESAERGEPIESRVDPRITRTLEHIDAHLSETNSVGALAAIAAMSPSRFASAFREQMDEPVGAYVRRRRAEAALELVMSTRLPLGQIAFDCGFSSQSHMTTTFQNLFETTPGRMRRNV